MQRVLRVHEVEHLVLERQPLGVRDEEREARIVPPVAGGLDVDRRDLANAPVEDAGDTAVAATAVEQGLVASKRILELVEAPRR